MKHLLIISVAFFFINSGYAQHNHSQAKDSKEINHVLACRSGVNFVDNLPIPQLMNGVGSSNLKINTSSEITQKYFNQGVSQLHCFWDLEAYRSFKEAIKNDSTAVMPYWGLLHTLGFINNEEFDKDKELAITKLKSLVEKANGFEAMYAKGILDMEETKNPKGYIKQLENVVHQYPDDTDAKLFLALFNMAGYDEDMNPKEGMIYSEYLLKDLLKTNPKNHGVHHYWIHQMENCCPEEALESANILESLAPESGHIVHMPGHIYYKIGDYKKAHDQFIKAMKVDSTYMSNQNITEIDNWNYIHNLNYLLANCAQDGRYNEGLKYAHLLENMVSVASRIDMHRGAYFYQGIITPAIMEMRFGFWEKAISKFEAIQDKDSLFGRQAMDYKTAFSYFSAGMHSLEKSNIDSAIINLDKLDALFWRSSQLENEKDRLNPNSLNTLKVASVELEGNILIAKKEYDKGIATLVKAVKMEKDLGYSEPPYYPRPALLSLAEAYIKNNQFDKAEACYHQMLEKHPNSAIANWKLMQLYKLTNKKDLLKLTTSKFKDVTQYGNREIFK
ncbi:tetratricopeptide repeat protein [Gaetbulibacter aquiaggeris]|uniref:Tetratricopeptide repeat protein n=1 Tax=Gaetbulibacter aquiaggeris TaxID=1735373 RepID=A0ABW7MQ71_9FLAO